MIRRWHEDGGYRELLKLAIPLVLSTGAWSVQHFVDRMFLSWYSAEAVAASMPAGILNFACMSFFIGTASYVSTFVAQYHGARRPDRIGPVVWQGVWVGALGGLALLALIPAAGPAFRLIGHAPALQRLETVYFRVLCVGAGPAIAASAMAGFYSGLGRTGTVMWVSIAATVVNLVLDYGLVFGHWAFPRLGIAGAALATTLSGVFSLCTYSVLLLSRKYRALYHTPNWRPQPDLFRRLWRYGAPSGLQFFVDIAGFSAFVLFVGRLGTEPLAAMSIAFNINTLAFLPMIGGGIAVSVLVGQRLGENRAELAERSTLSGAHLMFLYMGAVSLLYLLWPDLFIRPFGHHANPVAFAARRRMLVVFLRFVALYSLFDTMNIVFASALKGAGDTRFVMRVVLLMSLTLLVVPTYVALELFKADIYAAWIIFSAYVILLGFMFYARFRHGKWKQMRVIEPAAAFVAAPAPEAPTGV